MSNQTENAIINLVINGQQAISTYKQLNAERAKQWQLVQNLDKKAPNYEQQKQRLVDLTAAQREWRNELTQGAKQSVGFFKSFKDGFAEMAGNVTAATLVFKGVNAAIGALKDIWNGSEAAFKEAEQNQAQLGAVLKSTAGAAGLSQDALNDLATATMNKTGVDDDAINKSEALLLTFTNIHGEIFEESIPAILDMSKALGTDLEGATIQVGKALNNPIAGLTALKKVGVSFTEQQKEQIITMQKSGDMMGAQKIILGELKKEFGGTAEAIHKTSTGELEAFETNLGNVQERIGKVMAEGKAFLANFFGPFVKDLADARTYSEKLTGEFYSQKSAVAELEKNTAPLIERYDQLTTKGNLNKKEQVELNKIINTLSQNIPTAVTQWDKLGNAMGINTEKAREYIKMQKAVMAVQNKDAIDETNKMVETLEGKSKRILATLNSGRTTTVSRAGNSDANMNQSTRALTDKEVLGLSDQLKQIQSEIETAKLAVRGLRGENIEIPEITPPPQTGGGPTDGDKEKTKRDRDAYIAGVVALNAEIKSFNAEQLADTMAANDKEVEQLKIKYNNEIATTAAKLNELKEYKGKNAKEISDLEDKIGGLSSAREKAVADLRVKQDREMTESIIAFRNQMAGKLDTELQKETDLINKFYDERSKDVGDNELAQYELEINRHKELSDAKIREEKRWADEKIRISQDMAVSVADKEAAEKATINKKYDDDIAALKKNYSEQLQATQDFKDQLAIIEGARARALGNVGKPKALTPEEVAKQQQDVNTAIKQAAINSAQNIADASFEIAAENRQRELDMKLSALDKEKEAELKNKNLTESQKNTINEKYAKKEADIKLKAWESEKEAKLLQAIINGALAATMALASSPPPFNFIAAAAVGVATGLQISKIAESKAPKFEDGGFVPEGERHSEGGINLVGPYGQIYGNVEGGEPILSRDTYSNNKSVVDALLNSKGKRLDYDRVVAATTNREARRSVSTGTGGPIAGGASSTQNSGMLQMVNMQNNRLDQIERILDKQAAINELPIVWSDKIMQDKLDRNIEIRKNATA
jgi:hypothetical protein